MNFNFDSKVAQLHGVDAAILINNLAFWVKKNAANKRHFHNGNYWTYNSVKAFSILFPFWNERQLRHILENLQKDGVVLKGNFNESKYDRTCWYSLSDEIFDVLGLRELKFLAAEKTNENTIDKIENLICQKSQIDLTNLSNENDKNVKSYIGTYNNTDIKTQIGNPLGFFQKNAMSEWESFQMRFRPQIGESEWLRFCEVFDCKFIEEQKVFSTKIISSRLTRFAIAYVDNLQKAKKQNTIVETKPAYMLRKAI